MRGVMWRSNRATAMESFSNATPHPYHLASIARRYRIPICSSADLQATSSVTRGATHRSAWSWSDYPPGRSGTKYMNVLPPQRTAMFDWTLLSTYTKDCHVRLDFT